jgi:hypothetical protein
MENENEIIKAETPFYYVNLLLFILAVAVRPRARVITHKHESHQFDQLRERRDRPVVNKPRANSIIA